MYPQKRFIKFLLNLVSCGNRIASIPFHFIKSLQNSPSFCLRSSRFPWWLLAAIKCSSFSQEKRKKKHLYLPQVRVIISEMFLLNHLIRVFQILIEIHVTVSLHVSCPSHPQQIWKDACFAHVCTYFIGLLHGLNEVMNVKMIRKCLAEYKFHVSISYYYL